MADNNQKQFSVTNRNIQGVSRQIVDLTNALEFSVPGQAFSKDLKHKNITINPKSALDQQKNDPQNQQRNFLSGIYNLLFDIKKALTGFTSNKQDDKKTENTNEVVELEAKQLSTITTNFSTSLNAALKQPLHDLLTGLAALNTKLDKSLTTTIDNDSLNTLAQKLNTAVSTSFKDIDVTSAIASKIGNIDLNNTLSNKITGNVDLTSLINGKLGNVDLTSSLNNKIIFDNQQFNTTFNNQLTGLFNNVDINDKIQPITINLDEKVDTQAFNQSLNKVFDNVKVNDIDVTSAISNSIKETTLDLNDKVKVKDVVITTTAPSSELPQNIFKKEDLNPLTSLLQAIKASISGINEKLTVPKVEGEAEGDGKEATQAQNLVGAINSQIKQVYEALSSFNSDIDNKLTGITTSLQHLGSSRDGENSSVNLNTTLQGLKQSQEKISTALSAIATKVGNAVSNYFDKSDSQFYTNLKNTFDSSLNNKLQKITPPPVEDKKEEETPKKQTPYTFTDEVIKANKNISIMPTEKKEEDKQDKKEKYKLATPETNKLVDKAITVKAPQPEDASKKKVQKKLDYEYKNKDLEKLSDLVTTISVATLDINKKLDKLDDIGTVLNKKEGIHITLPNKDDPNKERLFQTLNHLDDKLDKLDYNKPTMTQKDNSIGLRSNMTDIFRALGNAIKKNQYIDFEKFASNFKRPIKVQNKKIESKQTKVVSVNNVIQKKPQLRPRVPATEEKKPVITAPPIVKHIYVQPKKQKEQKPIVVKVEPKKQEPKTPVVKEQPKKIISIRPTVIKEESKKQKQTPPRPIYVPTYKEPSKPIAPIVPKKEQKPKYIVVPQKIEQPKKPQEVKKPQPLKVSPSLVPPTPINLTVSAPKKSESVKPTSPVVEPKKPLYTFRPASPTIDRKPVINKPITVSSPLVQPKIPTPKPTHIIKNLDTQSKTLSVKGNLGETDNKLSLTPKKSGIISTIGNFFKKFSKNVGKQREQKPAPYSLENYLTSFGKYASLQELLQNRIGKNLKGLGKSIQQLNLGEGQDKTITVNGMIGGGQGGGIDPSQLTEQLGNLDQLKELSNLKDVKGLKGLLGKGGGAAGGAAAGGAGALGTAASIAGGALVAGVGLAGAYGAYNASKWDDEIGNTGGMSTTGSQAADGALAGINHIFGEGAWARLKTTWNSGDLTKLWGHNNQLDNEYTFAEHKALASLGKQKADELKRKRQDAVIKKRLDEVNKTNIYDYGLQRVGTITNILNAKIQSQVGTQDFQRNKGNYKFDNQSKRQLSQIVDTSQQAKKMTTLSMKLNNKAAFRSTDMSFAQKLSKKAGLDQNNVVFNQNMHSAAMGSRYFLGKKFIDDDTFNSLPTAVRLGANIRSGAYGAFGEDKKNYLETLSLKQLEQYKEGLQSDKTILEKQDDSYYSSMQNLFLALRKQHPDKNIYGFDRNNLYSYKRDVLRPLNNQLLDRVNEQITLQTQKQQQNKIIHTATAQQAIQEEKQQAQREALSNENKEQLPPKTQQPNVSQQTMTTTAGAIVQNDVARGTVRQLLEGTTSSTPRTYQLVSKPLFSTEKVETEEKKQTSFTVVNKDNTDYVPKLN